MKKLSEISKDTLLFVAGKKYPEDEFIALYDKEEFMQSFSEEEAKTVKVFIAKKANMPHFDLKSEIEDIGEEMYEDWSERVVEELGEARVEQINAIINTAINNNKAYIEGEPIDTTEFKECKKGLGLQLLYPPKTERLCILLKEKVKSRILYHSDETKYRYELGKAVIDECAEDIVKDIIDALEEG